MTQLYILAQEYRASADRLADLDLDERTVLDTLDGMSGELEAKATNVAMFIRNLEASAVAIREAEGQMAARRKSIEARAKRMNEYLLHNMQFAGVLKIESPHFALVVRNNPPAVVIDDSWQIPAEFMKQPEPPPPAPDKTAIKEAIKAGREVPGARLTQGVRLEIK